MPSKRRGFNRDSRSTAYVVRRGLGLHRGTSCSFKMAPKLSSAAAALVLCGSWLMIANSVHAYTPSVLVLGYTLNSGEYLSQGPFSFIMQRDCNLVVYKNGYPIWASNTGGLSRDCQFRLQGDGNGVVYSPQNRAIWATQTYGWSGLYIIVQCDGNVVMYTRYGYPVWHTNTAGRVEAIDLEEGNRLRKASTDSVLVDTVSAANQ